MELQEYLKSLKELEENCNVHEVLVNVFLMKEFVPFVKERLKSLIPKTTWTLLLDGANEIPTFGNFGCIRKKSGDLIDFFFKISPICEKYDLYKLKLEYDDFELYIDLKRFKDNKGSLRRVPILKICRNGYLWRETEAVKKFEDISEIDYGELLTFQRRELKFLDEQLDRVRKVEHIVSELLGKKDGQRG